MVPSFLVECFGASVWHSVYIEGILNSVLIHCDSMQLCDYYIKRTESLLAAIALAVHLPCVLLQSFLPAVCHQRRVVLVWMAACVDYVMFCGIALSGFAAVGAGGCQEISKLNGVVLVYPCTSALYMYVSG